MFSHLERGANRFGFWLGSHAPNFVVKWYMARTDFEWVCPVCGHEAKHKLESWATRPYCQCGNYMTLKVAS